MAILIACLLLAFAAQLVILLYLPGRHRIFRRLSLVLLELLPLGGALYYTVRRPPVPYLGWQFNAAMCLWIAGAVLLGYLLAWAAYVIKRNCSS